MDILVLSPCSKDKQYDPVLDCEAIDTHARADLVQEHSENVTTAADMYTGREHEHVKTAVSQLREEASVDWYIISTGFGLLREDTPLPSYECGFSKTNIASVRARLSERGTTLVT